MTDPGLSFPDQPRVDLDRRLSDLVQAANEVLATQGRLRALLHANQTITAQLDLRSVLRSVVDAARELTGAEYAALGVLGEHGDLEQFIHAGMEAETVERIGHLPHGKGLLGALIRDPHPIRVADIATDPRAAGFPAGHPPMRDFLGVPVRIRGAVYGNLYLTNHPEGRFSEEDEQLVRSLATTAGFAIENARLYRATRRQQEWAAASAEITAQLVTGDESGALALVAERMRGLADADSAFVVLTDDDPESFLVHDVEGGDPNRAEGARRPIKGSILERVLEDGLALRLDEREVREQGFPYSEPFGAILAVPLISTSRTLGALVLARTPGREGFEAADLQVAADFAGRASVALELQEARSDAERVMLFEDRGRIARDLHDRVIQQLFATGMQLQGVLGTLPSGRNAERVDAAITSLDESITQIRRIIFTLQSTVHGTQPVTGRQRLFDLIEQLSIDLSIDPSVHVSGPVDSVLDGDLAEDVLAVVHEGVSNAVKHAAAREISVAVKADNRGVTVTIANDGLPLSDSGRRSGLGNLEERAARRAGVMSLTAEAEQTVLRWTVPLRRQSRSQR